MKLYEISPIDRRVKEWLNLIQSDLYLHLELIPTLPEDTALKVLHYFIECSCQAQNIRNITLGREAISEIPREWVLKHIEKVANEMLNFEDDDWEFRRLAELYSLLDRRLVQELVKKGLRSRNPEVVEAAQDFS
jgi:hypothetical protein